MFFWQKKEKKVELPKGLALACIHYGACSKEKCPLWVTFENKIIVEGKDQVKPESKCSLAWTPQLLIEMRNSLAFALQTKQKVD